MSHVLPEVEVGRSNGISKGVFRLYQVKNRGCLSMGGGGGVLRGLERS